MGLLEHFRVPLEETGVLKLREKYLLGARSENSVMAEQQGNPVATETSSMLVVENVVISGNATKAVSGSGNAAEKKGESGNAPRIVANGNVCDSSKNGGSMNPSPKATNGNVLESRNASKSGPSASSPYKSGSDGNVATPEKQEQGASASHSNTRPRPNSNAKPNPAAPMYGKSGHGKSPDSPWNGKKVDEFIPRIPPSLDHAVVLDRFYKVKKTIAEKIRDSKIPEGKNFVVHLRVSATLEIVVEVVEIKEGGDRIPNCIPEDVIKQVNTLREAVFQTQNLLGTNACVLQHNYIVSILLTVDASLPKKVIEKVLTYGPSDTFYMGSKNFFGAPVEKATITKVTHQDGLCYTGFDVTNSIPVAINVAATLATAFMSNVGIQSERLLLQGRGLEIALDTKRPGNTAVTLSKADAVAVVRHLVGPGSIRVIKNERSNDGIITVGAVLGEDCTRKFSEGATLVIPIIRPGMLAPSVDAVTTTIISCQPSIRLATPVNNPTPMSSNVSPTVDIPTLVSHLAETNIAEGQPPKETNALPKTVRQTTSPPSPLRKRPLTSGDDESNGFSSPSVRTTNRVESTCKKILSQPSNRKNRFQGLSLYEDPQSDEEMSPATTTESRTSELGVADGDPNIL